MSDAYDNADYYSCDKHAEDLFHGNEDAAILAWVERVGMTPERLSGGHCKDGLTVYAFKRECMSREGVWEYHTLGQREYTGEELARVVRGILETTEGDK